jgi:hypothetical protein
MADPHRGVFRRAVEVALAWPDYLKKVSKNQV